MPPDRLELNLHISQKYYQKLPNIFTKLNFEHDFSRSNYFDRLYSNTEGELGGLGFVVQANFSFLYTYWKGFQLQWRPKALCVSISKTLFCWDLTTRLRKTVGMEVGHSKRIYITLNAVMSIPGMDAYLRHGLVYGRTGFPAESLFDTVEDFNSTINWPGWGDSW